MGQTITQTNLQDNQGYQIDNFCNFDSIVADIDQIYAAPIHIQQPGCCCVQRSNTSSTSDLSY